MRVLLGLLVSRNILEDFISEYLGHSLLFIKVPNHLVALLYAVNEQAVGANLFMWILSVVSHYETLSVNPISL